MVILIVFLLVTVKLLNSYEW